MSLLSRFRLKIDEELCQKEAERWLQDSFNHSDCLVCGAKAGNSCERVPLGTIHLGRVIPYETWKKNFQHIDVTA